MLILDFSPNTWIAFSLGLGLSWFRSWLYSGCALESLLLLFGPPQHWFLSRFALLICLHVVYTVASTSWLFLAVFTLICWPLVLATCLVQYTLVSSFTRGRLRALLKFAHFYRDRVAFFGVPSLVLDSGVEGLVTIRGITFSILDLSLEIHGIEIDLDLGSGHELSIHSDGISIKLFREITINEIYGVHWFDSEAKESEIPHDRRDSHVDDKSSSRNRRESLKTKLFSHRRDVSEDKVKSRPKDSQPDIHADVALPPDEKVRRNRVKEVLTRGDVEAEERYNRVLYELRNTNLLHRCRSQANDTHTSGDEGPKNERDHRPLICSNLRKSKPPRCSNANQITLSKLRELLAPISRLLDRVPVVLRLFLWLLSQSHPIKCPAICFSADGRYLGDELLESLFRKHAADDSRIRQLKHEVCSWVSRADVYIDFMNLNGQSTVPMLVSNNITADLRSTGVAISRLGARADDCGRVAQLSGADVSFSIPTCLLPSHASLAPAPKPNEDDTAAVFMAIRASLPAHFSDSFLNFAATLSKASQMVDIEEEAGQADKNNKPSHSGTDSTKTEDTDHKDSTGNESRTQRLRDKLPHVHLGGVPKHPISHLKQSLHKEVKKTAVDKVDGAWFAKWTNKCLEQLEWLDGDFGYSTEIPVGVSQDRRASCGSDSK